MERIERNLQHKLDLMSQLNIVSQQMTELQIKRNDVQKNIDQEKETGHVNET